MTGKKSNTRRSGFKTKREAKIELKRIQAQVANQAYYDVKDKKDMTFEDVYESWRESYKNTVAALLHSAIVSFDYTISLFINIGIGCVGFFLSR